MRKSLGTICAGSAVAVFFGWTAIAGVAAARDGQMGAQQQHYQQYSGQHGAWHDAGAQRDSFYGYGADRRFQQQGPQAQFGGTGQQQFYGQPGQQQFFGQPGQQQFHGQFDAHQQGIGSTMPSGQQQYGAWQGGGQMGQWGRGAPPQFTGQQGAWQHGGMQHGMMGRQHVPPTIQLQNATEQLRLSILALAQQRPTEERERALESAHRALQDAYQALIAFSPIMPPPPMALTQFGPGGQQQFQQGGFQPGFAGPQQRFQQPQFHGQFGQPGIGMGGQQQFGQQPGWTGPQGMSAQPGAMGQLSGPSWDQSRMQQQRFGTQS